ncbi:carboxypeptidase-like regulatory domain-containing protein [Pontibacter actiniarum]|uniref:Carboxypeptidase regulatory-like domain-containing protein n=1 Tax=Pontibacter actiniarum TaxID=323450 RepID=A0A1X9YN60_9BACT|nr:carboxypeptidase-like regulatory domain-containing protein [Pontibacter actiniarum]ARS34277.1 hypothetical protein CA264_01820 [Pontibacter actiniarum]
MIAPGKLQRYLLALVLLCCAPACSRQEDDYISKYCPGSCTVIKGHLTDATGTQPVAGVTLLARWHKSYSPGSSLSRKKAFAVSDADGNYTLRFLLRDDELSEGVFELVTSLEQETYTSCFPLASVYIGDIGRDTTVIQNITLAPTASATLDFTVAPEQGLRQGDRFQAMFTYKLSPTDPDSCSQAFEFLLSSQEAYETTRTFLLPANIPLALYIDKTKNGVKSREKKTITLRPDERSTYEARF